METQEIISLISIIASSLIGIFGVIVSAVSLIGARKDKDYMVKHTERLNEQKLVSEIVAKYVSTVSIAKLATLLRRAAAIKSEESVSEFMKSTEKLLSEIDTYTVEIISISEFSTNDIQEKILLLRKNHIQTINEINDLKAACSGDKFTSTQEDVLAYTQHQISVQLNESQTIYNEIIQTLYNILSTYIDRVVW